VRRTAPAWTQQHNGKQAISLTTWFTAARGAYRMTAYRASTPADAITSHLREQPPTYRAAAAPTALRRSPLLFAPH